MVPLAKHPTYTHDGAGLRKHADPPKLWIWLVAGSIAFHIGLWLMLPALLRAAARSSAATAATPIEFVDISTLDVATAPSVTPPEATASEAAASTQANPVPETATEPLESAQPPSIQPQQDPNIAFNPEFQPVPAPAPDVLQPDSAIAPQPSGVAERPTPQPPPQAPQPESSQPPQPLQPPAPTTPEAQLPMGNDSGSGLSGETLPPVPNIPETFPGDVAANPGPTNPNLKPGDIANPDGYDDGIGEIAVSGEAAPTNLQANIISFGTVPLEENPTDIPEQPAQAIQPSMSFVSDPMTPGSCIVPPESVSWFGAEIAIRVTVGADGRVLQTQVREGPGSPDYAELAECLIRQWQFNPASTSGIPVVSDNLIVYLTVNRL
ncbi:energy transducer TonB [Leptolyngbya sp. AN02str]|uniref:energy transducer TonB n=1 Tax=Leptolyngbya sp. AN02str TaxID=3423363 RepID=UPI003D323374